jgi:hypothetical protein
MEKYIPFFEDTSIDITKTPNFKKWFGNSKVVDRSGKPLVVYHGTDKKFDVFNKDKQGSKFWHSLGGFFFTDLKHRAQGTTVMNVYLNIQNPYVQTAYDYYGAVDKFDNSNGEMVKWAKEGGHDGIILSSPSGSMYVVFDPNQIKSTNNNGDFSKSKDSIYEDITIPLNKGGSFTWGKWKNKKAIFDHIEKDEKGQDVIVTDIGKRIPLLKIRLMQEDIKISDLMKSSMSAFTRKFNKETNKLMGNPTNHSKLVQAKANKKKDYIDFFWVTERTPKYKDNFNMRVVNPKTWKLHKDNLYTIQMRVFGIFELLKQEKKLSDADIETALMLCNIKVFSDVPAWHYQGGNYNLSILNGSLFPTDIPPTYWNKFHHSDQFLDKHSAGIFQSIKFYIPQMRQIIKKSLNK